MTVLKENKKEKFPLKLTLVLITGIFLVGADELILSPLLPQLVQDFNTSYSLASLTVSFYGLAIGLVVPFAMPFIDRISRAKLMGLSLMGFALSSVLCAISPNMSIMLMGRLLSGVFAGVYVPAVYAYVGDQVAFAYRGRVMGVVISGWSLSLIIGIPLGAYIGGIYHWRWTFIIIGFFSIMVSISSFKCLANERRLTLNLSHTDKFFNHFYEAIKIKEVAMLLLVTFCNMFGFYGMYTFLGSFIQETYSLSTMESGRVIFFYGLGIAMSPLSGLIIDYFGKKITLIAALLGLTVNLISISMLKLPLVYLYLLLIVWGGLQAIVLTSLNTLLSEQSSEYRGRIMSLYSLATNLAVAIGSWSMGIIYHSFGFQKIGMICGLITGFGGVLYFMLQPTKVTIIERKNKAIF